MTDQYDDAIAPFRPVGLDTEGPGTGAYRMMQYLVSRLRLLEGERPSLLREIRSLREELKGSVPVDEVLNAIRRLGS